MRCIPSNLLESFTACGAAALSDTRDVWPSDTEKIIMELSADWGHASAQRLKRVLVDSDGGDMRVANFVDGLLGRCLVCRAFDNAPRIPIAATSAMSISDEKMRVDHLFPGDIIALRAIGCVPEVFPVHRNGAST